MYVSVCKIKGYRDNERIHTNHFEEHFGSLDFPRSTCLQIPEIRIDTDPIISYFSAILQDKDMNKRTYYISWIGSLSVIFPVAL